VEKEGEEKPKIELVQSKDVMSSLFTVEFCQPVKEQLDQIIICGPNIEIKPCSPIRDAKCLPEIMRLLSCGPTVWGPLLAMPRCVPTHW
jgi:hypothetical protein